VPIRHGLQLAFHSTGRLQSQCWYEQGLSRWAITYHATGARERVGWYADREPLVYLEHGEHTRFSPGGAVVAQVAYVAGVVHGWAKFWEDDGHPIGATLYVEGRAVEQVLPDGQRRRS
jgi:antitoxin component YwqK of YwqJK toxin-antitoxin module